MVEMAPQSSNNIMQFIFFFCIITPIKNVTLIGPINGLNNFSYKIISSHVCWKLKSAEENKNNLYCY